MNQSKSVNATRVLSFLLVLILTLALTPRFSSNRVQAAAVVNFNDVAAFYQFGIQATFQARLQSSSTIQEVALLIQSDGQKPITRNLTPGTNGEVISQLDLAKETFRAFAPVEYWFKAKTADGSLLESQHYSFDYIDNRFTWQNTSDGRFDIHWNSSDLTLGDMVLQVALDSLRSAVGYLPVSPPLPIRIFIYSSGQALQEALQLGQMTWIAGHASPDLNLVLISLPPSAEQQLELERQLPHEIMHILQYQVTGDRYISTPPWLIEGMASLAELYPNPDYPRALDQAVKSDTLLPIQGFCSSFPTEASLAIQAYAESTSFVKFLGNKFGLTSLQNLLQKFGDGMECNSAVQTVFNADLNQLEVLWKQEALGMDSGAIVLKNLSPYLFLAGLILLPPLVVLIIYRRRKSLNTVGV